VPVGLAHDAVSRRFVLGDRRAHRLLVIDEVSRHVVNYVSGSSAGFYDELAAFTIDSRRGDLWVVSNKGEADGSMSVLHKLQLVSGRTLLEARTPDAAVPVRLIDVTVTPDGTVYAIDAIDVRIFRLRPGARTLESVMRIEGRRRPTAITAADDHTLYVAAEAGIVRVDVAARSATPVKSPEALTDFDSLSWRAGSLIGVEQVTGTALIVRVALDAAGTRAQPRAVLATSPQATVGALTIGAYYYLAGPGVINRIALR
jgi:streptogramin lyase